MLWIAKNKKDPDDCYRLFGNKPVRFVDKPVKIFDITLIKAEETCRWVDENYEKTKNTNTILYCGVKLAKSCSPVNIEWDDEPVEVKFVLCKDYHD